MTEKHITIKCSLKTVTLDHMKGKLIMDKGALKGRPIIDDLCVNTIRTLAMDAVQKAKSGNPGAPMGLAASQ